MESLLRDAPALEDRLRGLILSNTAGSDAAPIAMTEVATTSAGAPALEPRTEAEAGELPVQKSPRPSSRKRPNQAQRRQMSAQLSIPIDPRPAFPSSSHLFTSPPGQHHPPSHQAPNHQQQRPHTASFQPPSQNHRMQLPNSPERGGTFIRHGFPNHPHHHQSRSYDHPVPGDQQPHWRSQQRQLYDPGASSPRRVHENGATRQHALAEQLPHQVGLLEGLCATIITDAEISYDEILVNERFRIDIEHICRAVIHQHEVFQNGNPNFHPASVQLRCFGSLSSGFATKASDMDLGLLSPQSLLAPDDPKSPIPRLIEKAFLESGLGARLLSRTRVPIIKLCERPPEELRLGLLEERAKWERGEGEENEPSAGDEAPHDEAEAPQSPVATINGPAATPAVDELATPLAIGSEAYNRKLGLLKQGTGQELDSYWREARKLLRKLGGQDIKPSTVRDFDEGMFKLLTDVALAFVHGLKDDELRIRLERSRSVSFSGVSPLPKIRSLLGVYWQAEGEKLAMIWGKRSMKEKDFKEEMEAAQMAAWAALQDRPSFGTDPATYNKELQLAVEAMRRIPSIRLHLLQQTQNETPADYYSRAASIMRDRKIRDHISLSGNSGHAALQSVVRHYIMGICDHDIRTQVTGFLAASGALTLRAAGRRHKSLQLARELERALAKDEEVYRDHRAMIEQYVAVLRRPMQRLEYPDGQSDHVLRVHPEEMELIRHIRSLPEPAKLKPNQSRDQRRNQLEFPKSGAGVQCDINFSAHLAMQNTLLLRCYSHTDPRVRPLVLFVKHWAKVRGINSPYHGTLSSYGYVLMMLHYLVNVVQPFVCPNLQELAPPLSYEEGTRLSREDVEATVECRGRNVRFWRDEEGIKRLAAEGSLNQNRDSIGYLLRGFFEYYAQNGPMSTLNYRRGFDWSTNVISLRTPGGLLTKSAKGWTSAKTVHEVQGQQGHQSQQSPEQQPQQPQTPQHTPQPQQPADVVKEVRHRYLFAIEDPFELDHNVARTVMHHGIVSIRDEFRRAWRIIRSSVNPATVASNSGILLQDIAKERPARQPKNDLSELVADIHGGM